LHSAAQDTFEPATYLGVTGGVNICYVNFNPYIKQGVFTSYSAGIIFRHVSEPHIGIQFEISSSGKGWIEDAGTYQRTVDVLDLPVMAVFTAGKKTMRLSFMIGPYLSYRRQEKEIITIINSSYIREYYGKPLERKMEAGFIGGAGIEAHTRAGVFAVKATFSHSMTNLFPLDVSEFYYEGSRMMVLNGSLYYMVRF